MSGNRFVGNGRVIWLTGLSGSGKTTLSQLLVAHLREAGVSTILLDGDVVREAFGDELGHTREDRYHLATRYARMCRLLAEQGVTVVCSTISLFHDIHNWNRENLPGYLEVYLRASVDALAARDPKGIYARARNGELRDVVGIDIPAEEPREPDIVIDTTGPITPDEACHEILRACALESPETAQ